MRPESLEFLKRLLNTPSPVGHEEAIQKVVAEYMAPFAPDIYKDVHGNQYHVLNKAADMRIMFAGHVDEIGFMVNTIDDKGFIGVVALGGIDSTVVLGQRVIVQGKEGPVNGVLGRKPIHLQTQEERGKAIELHKMHLDIGSKSKEETESLVAIGDPITIDQGYFELRNDRIVARALDDRIGAFVVCEAARLLSERHLNVALYAVTTVQEEVGLRGATTSAYGVNPHAGIAVDVNFATDHPNSDGDRYGKNALDDGPIIPRGPNTNRVMYEQLRNVASQHEISWQPAAEPRGTGTDAFAIQMSRGGTATVSIGVPNRYMHTPVETVSLADVENCSKLLCEWVASLKGDESFIP